MKDWWCSISAACKSPGELLISLVCVGVGVGVCVCTQSLNRVQLFETLWAYGPPGSSACGISQARILVQVAISYSRGSSLTKN